MSQYQIVQLQDTQDPSILRFPVTPVEALVQSVNERTTPLIVQLSQWSDNLLAPTAANQYAYKPTANVVCVSSEYGSSFVWSPGSEPQDGKLYMWSGRLYVKCTGNAGTSLEPLVLPDTTGYAERYEGPFAVSYLKLGSGACACDVAAGKVFAPWSAYNVPVSSGIVVSSASDLYIVGSSGTSMSFKYTTDEFMHGHMRTRIAHNAGGRMVQYQYGDILFGGVTSSSGPTPPTPTPPFGDMDYTPISVYGGGSPEGYLVYSQIAATDGRQHTGDVSYSVISSYVDGSGVLLSDLSLTQIDSTDGQIHSGAIQYTPVNSSVIYA